MQLHNEPRQPLRGDAVDCHFHGIPPARRAFRNPFLALLRSRFSSGHVDVIYGEPDGGNMLVFASRIHERHTRIGGREPERTVRIPQWFLIESLDRQGLREAATTTVAHRQL